MTTEKRDRIVEVMRLIQEDCDKEARELDGQPFSGRIVAVQFGNILASISALAQAVEYVLKEES